MGALRPPGGTMSTLYPQLEQEEAACVVNSHGRILGANGRFCRLFGFTKDETIWHYLPDLYRHESEWKIYREATGDDTTERHFLARLRNRKGRSFKCMVTRTPLLSPDGQTIFLNAIAKIVSTRDAIAPRSEATRPTATQIFFTICSGCSRVKDGSGEWILSAEAQTTRPRRSRQSHYCPDCAARLFPGVFERGASVPEDEPIVAVR